MDTRGQDNHATGAVVLRMTADGRLVPLAGAAEAMLAAEPSFGSKTLAGLFAAAHANGGPVTARWLTAGPPVSEWDIVVAAEADGALVTGIDRSSDRALLQALVDSRGLYRDLITCLAGLGFETDAEGRFTYLSAPTVLGHEAENLIGQPASRLLADPSIDPFISQHRQKLNDLAMKTATGEAALWSVALRPVFAEDGSWAGTRGIAEDVTVARARERALRLSEGRESLLARFVLMIRDAVTAKALLEAAMKLVENFSATDAWILKHEEREFRPQLHRGEDGEMPPPDVMAALANCARSAKTIHVVEAAGGGHLICILQRQLEVIGALVVVRDTEVMPWRDEELALAGRMTDHLSVALQDARNRERLELLAHVDELTGLLNRRAFDAAVETALALGDGGSLLYIDLDYFKQVNDTRGHAAGDEVLAALGAVMKSTMRGSDLAGRRGGDEFVAWLPGATPEVARRVAENLIAFGPELRNVAGDASLPLGLSIGIAHAAPGMSYGELTEAADAALYAAKAAGRGRYVEGD